MKELPEGKEWATAPLLDPSNVGKYVWAVWNSNHKQAEVREIIKVGRTNIHVHSSGAPWSLRASDTRGGYAYGQTSGGHGLSACTEQYRVEQDERHTLMRQLAEAQRAPLSFDKLRRIVAIINEQEQHG